MSRVPNDGSAGPPAGAPNGAPDAPLRGKNTMRTKMLFAAAAALACSFATPAAAQDPGQAIVSLYHAPPGHQIELLKWIAGQDRVAAAAGVAQGQLYVHTDGDSWDYMLIQPVTTAAQDAAMEAAGKKLGIDAGPRAAIEFRKHIQSHTDTFVRGPMTAAQYLAAVGER